MVAPCIICYRPNHDVDVSAISGVVATKVPGNFQVMLKDFFRLLERYFTDKDGYDIDQSNREEEDDTMRLVLDQLIDAGMLCCSECSKTVESFCSLYTQMTTIRIQLEGKLQNLENIISSAHQMPERIRYFEESVNQLDIDDVGIGHVDILDFTKDLIKKCRRKRKSLRSSPTVPLKKSKFQEGVPKQTKRSEAHRPHHINSFGKDDNEGEQDPLADFNEEIAEEEEEEVQLYPSVDSVPVKDEVVDEASLEDELDTETGTIKTEDNHHDMLMINDYYDNANDYDTIEYEEEIPQTTDTGVDAKPAEFQKQHWPQPTHYHMSKSERNSP